MKLRLSAGMRRVVGRIDLPFGVVLVACLIQGFAAIWFGSKGWFSGDLLHYYVERGGAPGGTEGLNEPHQAHWQLLLILVYLVLFKFFGLTTFVPYMTLSVLVHVGIVVMLFLVLRRLAVSPWLAVFLAVCVLTYGRGSEVFLVEAPVALIWPLLLALVATYLLLRTDFSVRSTRVTSLLLLAGVMMSVGGVVASVWVGFFALSRGWRMMARVIWLPAASFGAWFLIFGRGSQRVLMSGADWLEIPALVWHLLVIPVSDLLGGVEIGPTALVALVVIALVRSNANPQLAALALAGLFAAVAQAVLSSVAQQPYGVEQVLTSRYRYVVLVACVPALALALQWLVDVARTRLHGDSRRLALVGAAVILTGVVVNGALWQWRTATTVESGRERVLSLLGGIAVAQASGQELINDAVPGSYDSGRDLERLVLADVRNEVPPLNPSPENRIRAEAQFYIQVIPANDEDAVKPTAPAEIESDSFERPLFAKGCHNYRTTWATPVITLRSFMAAGITVKSDAESVSAVLRRADEGLTSDPVTFRMTPGKSTRIATTAQLVEMELTFDRGGEFTICSN